MRALTTSIETVVILVCGACTSFAGLDVPHDAGSVEGHDASAGDGAAPSAYSQAVTDDRPLAYWRLNETIGPAAVDVTGHGHACTYAKDVTLGATGAFPGARAISLPGVATAEGFVECSDPPFDFAGNAPFSLEAWIHPDVADDVYRRVFSKEARDPQDRRRGYNIDVAGPHRIRFERFEADQELCGAENVIELGVWSHVLATFDGTTSRLYVNGRAASDACSPTGLADLPALFIIGVQSDKRYGFFQGAIEEAAVYDHALSPERVAAHYAAGLAQR